MKQKTIFTYLLTIPLIMLALTGCTLDNNTPTAKIPHSIDPEETVIYYCKAWDKGDYQTMDALWSDHAQYRPDLLGLKKLAKNVASVTTEIRKTSREKNLLSSRQEGYYDAVVVYVTTNIEYRGKEGMDPPHNYYLIKETADDDWRIIEWGNG